MGSERTSHTIYGDENGCLLRIKKKTCETVLDANFHRALTVS